MNKTIPFHLFFICLVTENCKNTWPKDLKNTEKNSKMYKITHTHIITSRPTSGLMIKRELRENEKNFFNITCWGVGGLFF